MSPKRVIAWAFLRLAALGILAASLGLPAAIAQDGLPASVVLVLNLLSETHARPVTGVVIDARGTVVVPASFVGRGDEIIVLDGGTDLDRHGRPTRTTARSSQVGLALLQAEKLSIGGMAVSADEPAAAVELRLVAYPAAEELAGGEPPLERLVRVSDPVGDSTTVADADLPNVNGVLLDGCGQLAGLALAREQSGEEPGGPVLLVFSRFRKALSELGVTPDTLPCRTKGQLGKQAPVTTEAPDHGPQMLDPLNLQPAVPRLGPDSSAGAVQGPARSEVPAMRPSAAEEDMSVSAEPAIIRSDSPPETPRDGSPARNLLMPGAALGVAMVSVLVGWLLGRRTTPAAQPEPGDERASLDSEAASTHSPSRVAQHLLRARYPDGNDEAHAFEPDSRGWTLGRGQADFLIGHESVSRLHARIGLDQGGAWLQDLGSSRGTWVGRTACQDGEIFFLDGSMEFVLGEVVCRLEVADSGAAS